MKRCLQLAILFLLTVSVSGLGQQDSSAQLTTLLAAAQQAQTAGNFDAAAANYKKAVQLRPEIPELWANLGLMQHEAGEISAAMHSFETANRLKPSLYVPNLFLGMEYLHIGNAARAVPLLEKSQELNATDPQPRLILGRAYLSLGKYDLAAEELRKALSLNPELSSAWFVLGIADTDKVEQEARVVTKENPDDPYAQTLYAESLEKQSRFREASAILSKVAQSSDQPPCVGSDLGYVLIRQHDPQAAASQFATERKEHPECPLSFLGEARLAIEFGENGRAVEALQQLWRRDEGYLRTNTAMLTDGLHPDVASNWIAFVTNLNQATPNALYGALVATQRRLGSSAAAEESALQPASVQSKDSSAQSAEKYYQDGQFARCTAQLRAHNNEHQPHSLQLLAACSFFTGDFQQTSTAAAQLEAIEPHSIAAHYWSIKAHERLASQELDRFQQLEPNSAKTHILLGDIYRQRMDYDNAILEYKKALAITPGDIASLMGLASAYLGNNDIEAAIASSREALSKSPDDPELNLLMAEAIISNHHYADALPFLEKSRNVKSQMLPHVHALLGRVDAETGKTQEAIQELELGVSSDDDGTVHYLLARLYHQIGDTKRADLALAKMQEIKQQRRDQKLIAVDDSDMSLTDVTPK